MLHLLLALLAAEGRPLVYWGSQPAVIIADAPASPPLEARASEVHALLDREGLVLRFSFDRPVRQALLLPDGTPVSGRLQAVLYLDVDDNRTTGFDGGPGDLRTGADRRLEVGVVYVGADEEERRKAAGVVTATLAALAPDGRRRTLWRADDASAPRQVSVYGEWIEVRLPQEAAAAGPGARLILAVGDEAWDGRLAP